MKWEEVYNWSLEEFEDGSRVRASKLMKIAEKMRKLFYDNWDKENRY
jgi:hypothetical protein